MSEKQTILELEGVSKYFPGVKALDKVQLTLNKGEVLGLIGENGAGKSTLMKILLGIYPPDEGSMEFKGETYSPHNPSEALHKGITMIHQEISLVPSMTVAENIWIGREKNFTKYGLLDVKSRDIATQKLLENYNLNINPSAEVASLNIANMQLVEIMRAISYDSDVIIMDEPTSALTNTEIEMLYRIIKELAAKEKSIIFISHKLDELFEICNRITVLRDGLYIDTKNTEHINQDDLVRMMVGREISDMYPKADVELGEVALKVRNLSRKGSFTNISFDVREGEILGFCGLMGSQRTEIMQALFGIDKADSGTVELKGRQIQNRSVQQAIHNHFAMVTEDRLRLGCIHKLSVKINLSLSYLKQITKMGFVNQKQESEDCNKMVGRFRIKISSLDQTIGSLSGGNQQKVILGKWMLTDPTVLILDEPTRGIDVGSKTEIYKLIGELAQQKKVVIVVSSELPEVMGISDRIMVVREGRIVAEKLRGDFHQDELMSYAFGLTEPSYSKGDRDYETA